MIRLSEKAEKELEKLTQKVIKIKKENSLMELAEFFEKWGKTRKEFKKAEEKILDFYHMNESLKSSDPFLLVADAISYGVLTEKDLSAELFQSLEVVVRMLRD